MADDLVADLAQMHDMATRLMPNLASEFAAASVAVNNSRGMAQNAMEQTYSPWEDLSVKLQQALYNSSTNLYDAGTVLAKTAEDFAKQDSVHAQWLNENKERIEDGTAGPPPPKNPVKPVPPGPSNGDDTDVPPWEQSA